MQSEYYDLISGIIPKDVEFCNPDKLEETLLKSANWENRVGEGIAFIKQNSDIFVAMISYAHMMISSMERYISWYDFQKELDNKTYFSYRIRRINKFIESYDFSGYDTCTHNSDEYHEMFYPITLLDASIYCLIALFDLLLYNRPYDISINDIMDITATEESSLFPALVYIFRNIQINEATYKKSFMLDSTVDSKLIIEVLIGNWNDFPQFQYENIDNNHCRLIELSIEKQKLSDYASKRRINKAKDYCHSPEVDNIRNELNNILTRRSTLESDTLNIILHPYSPTKKIEVIERYIEHKNDHLLDSDGKYNDALLRSMITYFMYAWPYCSLSSGKDNYLIPVHKFNFQAALFPEYRFNDLLIYFHYFRLVQDEYSLDKLLRVFLTAELYGNRNLDSKSYYYLLSDNDVPFEEIIMFCYKSMVSSHEQNNKYIRLLRLNRIQKDRLFGHERALSQFITSKMIDMDDYNQFVDNSEVADKFSDNIRRSFITGFGFRYNKHSNKIVFDYHKISRNRTDWKKYLSHSLKRSNKQKQENLMYAKVLVSRVNSIHLFRRTLEILETNVQKFDFEETIDLHAMIVKLKRIDEEIVKGAYVPQSESMNEYRLKKGIDPSEIKLQESKTNYYYLVNHLHSEIQNSSSIESLFKLKHELEELLIEIPEDQRSFYKGSVTNEIKLIQSNVIQKCISANPNEYTIIQNCVYDILGESRKHISEKVISPLCSAELLYKDYVDKEDSPKQFDYSGISSLYYQAVEALINELIWSPYAAKLNALTSANESFAEQYSSDKYLSKDFVGYLPLKSRKYYVDQKNNCIKNTITLGTAFHLFKNSYNGNYCEFEKHLERVFTPSNGTNTNVSINSITSCLSGFANRNTASHGGQIVTKEQCKIDKENVFTSDSSQKGVINLIAELLNANHT